MAPHEYVNSDLNGFDSNCAACEGKHRDCIHTIGRYARSVEAGWLGKIIGIDYINGDTMFKMMGVNSLYRMIEGGDIEDALDEDDIQWFSPADVRMVELV